MIEQVSVIGLPIAAGGLAGFVIGLIYFRHLRQSLENFCGSGSPLKLVVGSIARILAAVGLFVVLMQWSAVAALSGLVGFSLARSLLVTKEGLI